MGIRGSRELGWRMTCTLESLKSKELMFTLFFRMGRGRFIICSRSFRSVGILGFGLWKCRLGV